MSQLMKPAEKQQTLEQWFEKGMPAMKQVMNRALPPDRFARMTLSVLRRNPDLLNCDQASLWNAVLNIAKWGLEPGADSYAEAYIVPFKGEATAMPSYKGLLKMVRRGLGRMDVPIYAHEVKAGDRFKVSLGFPKTLLHEPDYEDPDRDAKPTIFYYAVVAYSTTECDFEVLSKAQVEVIRNRAPSRNSPAWRDNYDEMGKKSALRKLCKRLNLSPEESETLSDAERVEWTDAKDEVAAPPMGKLDALKADHAAKKTIDAPAPGGGSGQGPESGGSKKDDQKTDHAPSTTSGEGSKQEGVSTMGGGRGKVLEVRKIDAETKGVAKWVVVFQGNLGQDAACNLTTLKKEHMKLAEECRDTGEMVDALWEQTGEVRMLGKLQRASEADEAKEASGRG